MGLPRKRIPFITIAITLSLLGASCRRPSISPDDPPALDAGLSCPAGDSVAELASGGQVRQFRLHVPASYDADQPAALVLGFHGAGSNAAQFESYTRFSALADREGFLAVYPQGLGEHPAWNTTAYELNRDVQFVRDLIDHLQARCAIDPRRVYAAGHSNGGGLANRLACSLSGAVAAIGSVAGAYQGSERCEPSGPVPVIGVHGDRDPVIPYNGPESGEGPPAAYFTVSVPVPQWASSWASRNGCGKSPEAVPFGDRVSGQAWSGCDEGADVILYTVHGGGHGWPAAFDAAQLLWDFFEAHPGRTE